ncbi:MAG TPA: thiamine pyrophosphate-binding protein, partial [Candidatus Eisenbacteria bacterium]|nr:thiamine pyrophosphate-binding protein [Candidatus Eisenbacteria bacterium]
MAVRDLDLSAGGSGARIRVLGNRGVNGIDGVVSSALGASAAADGPLAAVVGDLSFHHDLNALAAIREGRAAATIVVVNNDGGGIFSFLPAARHEVAFERYFGTPHGLDVAKVASLYGVPYARCASAEELRARAGASLAARTTVILEVRTERGANRDAHQTLADAVRRAVEGAA